MSATYNLIHNYIRTSPLSDGNYIPEFYLTMRFLEFTNAWERIIINIYVNSNKI